MLQRCNCYSNAKEWSCTLNAPQPVYGQNAIRTKGPQAEVYLGYTRVYAVYQPLVFLTAYTYLICHNKTGYTGIYAE